jgi:hypothetical protein
MGFQTERQQICQQDLISHGVKGRKQQVLVSHGMQGRKHLDTRNSELENLLAGCMYLTLGLHIEVSKVNCSYTVTKTDLNLQPTSIGLHVSCTGCILVRCPP